MSEDTLLKQMNDLINGTISEADHRELQTRLKTDASARSEFLSRMDLESGLRTWAETDSYQSPPITSADRKNDTRRINLLKTLSAIAVTAAAFLLVFTWWPSTQQPQPIAGNDSKSKTSNTVSVETNVEANPVPNKLLLGRIVEQADCRWEATPSNHNSRFSAGTISLASGAAELQFDTGTNMVMEGPCEVSVQSGDGALLLAGSVFVHVTEVSNGFILETPESQIIDEGTQYAVSLDSDAAEIHVFDGNVIWSPTRLDTDIQHRIPSGEARRYLRSDPQRSHHIPFGQRQFVRQIESQVRSAGAGELIAYDGFENLAGQLRRGRSGFGWEGGWMPVGRNRGALGQIIDSPHDVIFGVDRSGRRLLSLRRGDELKRKFQQPIVNNAAIYVSLIASRRSSAATDGLSLQISLEPDSSSPRYTRRHSVSFGITSEGAAFINNEGRISKASPTVDDDQSLIMIFKYQPAANDHLASIRIYREDESIDSFEPQARTTASSYPAAQFPSNPTNQPPAKRGTFGSIRISAGRQAHWQVDELKIGTSWNAVSSPPANASKN